MLEKTIVYIMKCTDFIFWSTVVYIILRCNTAKIEVEQIFQKPPLQYFFFFPDVTTETKKSNSHREVESEG